MTLEWDMDPRRLEQRDMVSMLLPDPEVKIEAKSSYTKQNVLDELARLRGVMTDEGREQRRLLRRILKKKGWA